MDAKQRYANVLTRIQALEKIVQDLLGKISLQNKEIDYLKGKYNWMADINLRMEQELKRSGAEYVKDYQARTYVPPVSLMPDKPIETGLKYILKDMGVSNAVDAIKKVTE